ncbi:MAG: hypothetical protein AAFU73_17925 [Planctomycetota bacterium]
MSEVGPGNDASGAAGAAPSGAGPGGPGSSSSGAEGSTLFGRVQDDTPEEASRVLGDALKRAPLPSVAGLCFELMGLAWVIGAFLGVCGLSHSLRRASGRLAAGPESALEVTSWFDIARIVNAPPSPRMLLLGMLCAAPLVWISVRIAAGLARIASEGEGSGANALRVWRLGAPVQLSALGVWGLVAAMMGAAMVVLFLPLAASSRIASETSAFVPVHVVLSGLGVAFAVVYGAGLGAVQELAMASLVRHERGVGSAVLHAWRMIRSRRATSHRMAFVEAASRVAVVGLAVVLAQQSGVWAGLAGLTVAAALTGGIRCQAWSLAYPRVGGI